MISAIVLGAGLSTRMGRSKLVLRVDGVPILERVLVAFREAKVDDIVVVLGSGYTEIKREVHFAGERVVVNPKYEAGMSSSLRLGLRSISRNSEAAFIALGDQPFLSPATVGRMVEALVEKKAPIIVPVYRGERGNPILFSRSVFPKIMKIRGDVGAKSVVEAYGKRVLEVSVSDDGVLFDIDTPSDYERAIARPPAPTRTRTRGGA